MQLYKYKLLRITTVPLSLSVLLNGQFRYFQSNGFEVTCVSCDSPELYEVGTREGVSVKSVEMTRKITPLKDCISLWSMYKLIKEIKPDIVHSHTPKAGIISMVAALLAGVPIRLHTVAGLPLMESKGAKKLLLKGVEFLTYSCSTKVLPNSYGLQDYIVREKLVSRGKTKVLGNGSSNGIDTSYFSIATIDKNSMAEIKFKLGIQESDFVFIFVGRLVTDKGINELVESFIRFQDASKSNNRGCFKLLMVGPFETDLDPLYKDTLSKIRDNNSIIVTGFKSDVRPYFAISNCLIFPSYREGFPNVVLQAAAMGLPSIVSDINGCNEIINDGINGLVVPPKNISSLVSAMQKISSEHALRNRLGIEARRIIKERYEQSSLWNLQKEEYLNLLSSAKKY